MANLCTTYNKRRHIADKFYHFKKIKSKVQRKAADIGFVRKALSNEVTPTFAKVKGQFKTTRDKWKAEKLILDSHLREHLRQMKLLVKQLEDRNGKLKNVTLTGVLRLLKKE